MKTLYKKIILPSVMLLHFFSHATPQQVVYDWQHVIPGYNYTASFCMAVDSSGNLYMGGCLDSVVNFIDTTVSNTTQTGFLVKYDTDGNLVWFKQFEYSSLVYSICFDSEDRLLISGSYTGKVKINDTIFQSYDTDTTYLGMFLAKFNTDGELIWAKTTAGSYYYDTGYGKLKQMTIDKDDNIVVVGYTYTDLQYFDTTATYTKTLDSVWTTTPYPHWVYFYHETNYMAKFDKNGQKLWIKDLGMYGQRYYAIATDNSNNILLTGRFGSSSPFILDTIVLNASGGENLFIAKYNSDGQINWAQRGGGGTYGPNIGYDICIDINDNIYLTGVINGGIIEFGGIEFYEIMTKELFLTRFNGSGNLDWFSHYGTEETASNFDYGLTLSYKNDEVFLSGFFADSLNLGFTILDAYHYPPWHGAGLFMRFNTDGTLLGAAMDHPDYQVTPNTFFPGNNGEYYVCGNLWSTDEENIMIGRFPGEYLSDINENTSESSNFIVAPNPCADHFRIFTSEEPPFLLEIYSLMGSLILSIFLEENISQVDVSMLEKGIYIVKLNNISKKIIVY